MSNAPNTRKGKVREYNLDKRRAARAEARGEPPTLVGNGRTFVLLHELPMAFVETLAEGKIRAAMRMLLEDPAEDGDAFVELGFTNDDLQELTSEIYGADLGES